MIYVELRKMFQRKEFYILNIIMIFIGIFVIYQIGAEGSLVQVKNNEGSESSIPLSELIIGIIGLFNMLGVTAIISCMSTWNLIGTEVDNKILNNYFLNARKWFSFCCRRWLLR